MSQEHQLSAVSGQPSAAAPAAWPLWLAWWGLALLLAASCFELGRALTRAIGP